MFTLSQLVDELVIETLKPTSLAQFVLYANQTIRELHQDRNGNAIGFRSNRVETEITSPEEDGYLWPLPKPERIQMIESIYFPDQGDYAIEVSPSTALLDDYASKLTWYRTGDSIAFSNYGAIGSKIRVAYYQYPRRLQYYAAGARPCEYNLEDEEWDYAPAYDSSDATRLNAKDRCTNWLIQRHYDFVAQGTRSKLYTRLKDMDRARIAYAAYKELQPGVVSAEEYQSGVMERR